MYCIARMTLPTGHKYKDKDKGRYRWQMDLSQKLIAYALDAEWGKTEDERTRNTRPWWTRSLAPVPCDCKTCWHCLRGETKGIMHPARPLCL